MSSGAGMNGRPRLSAAQTRALELAAAGDDQVSAFDLAWLLTHSLVEPIAAVDDYDGPCLTLGLTVAGRRVLKEEEERAATAARNQEEES